MGKEFDFKSQICTDRFQSERPLALGLKPETADMTIIVGVFIGTNEDGTLAFDDVPNAHPPILKKDIPAWSLGRLVEIIDKCNFESFESDTWRKEAKKFCRYLLVSHSDDLIETSVELIETLIEKEYFNKEYLED